MSKRLIGYGYTNANGVATLDYDAEGNELESSGYVGQGVGEVDISASAVIDGSTFVSETNSILDCTFMDNGTTEHDSTNYIINASLTERLVTDGVNVSKNASGSNAGNYRLNKQFTGDFTALVELKSTGKGVRVGIMDSTTQRAFGNFNQSEFTQVKIVKTNTTLTVQQYINNEWVDLSITGLASVDLTGTIYFNLYIYNTTTDTDFTFKNLKIYPI